MLSRLRGKDAVYPDPNHNVDKLNDSARKRADAKLAKARALLDRLAEDPERTDLKDDALDAFKDAIESQSGRMGLCHAAARSARALPQALAISLAAALFDSAVSRAAAKDFEGALEALATAIAIHKTLEGEESKGCQRALAQAGALLQRAPGTPFERAQRLEKGTKYFGQCFGPMHPVMAQAWIDLADVHQRAREMGMSLAALREAEKVQRALASQTARNDPALATTLLKMGHCEMASGRFSEAKTLFEEASAMHKVTLGPKHALTREGAQMAKAAGVRAERSEREKALVSSRAKARRAQFMESAARRAPSAGGGMAPSTVWEPPK
jgi:tetratricopeptide (TPR) repeat protein